MHFVREGGDEGSSLSRLVINRDLKIEGLRGVLPFGEQGNISPFLGNRGTKLYKSEAEHCKQIYEKGNKL